MFLLEKPMPAANELLVALAKDLEGRLRDNALLQQTESEEPSKAPDLASVADDLAAFA